MDGEKSNALQNMLLNNTNSKPPLHETARELLGSLQDLENVLGLTI